MMLRKKFAFGKKLDKENDHMFIARTSSEKFFTGTLRYAYQMRLGVFAPRFYQALLDKFPLKICDVRRKL